MANFHEDVIKRRFSADMYQRGLQLYNNDRVSHLVYDRNFQIWSATVQDREDYFVEVNTTGVANGKFDVSCSCPAFAAFGTCEHIAAVLLAIDANEMNNPLKLAKDYRAADWLMQSIESLSAYQPVTEITQQKVKLHVAYTCRLNDDHNLVIELRVGETRPLVVRKIEDFLQDVFNDREHYFTKTFTYHPEMHSFDEQDWKIFAELYDILNQEKIYYDRDIIRHMETSSRSVIIPPLAARQLIRLLTARDLTVKMPEGEWHDCQVIEGSPPFSFELRQMTNGELSLHMEGVESATYLPPYEMLWMDGIFYFPEKAQLPVIEQITTVAKQSSDLPVTQEQADDFISQVVPSLEKIGTIRYTDDITNQMVQLPLEARLYLSLRDEWMVGNLTYYYGDYEIDPFAGRDEDNMIIVRDVEKESQIMQLIEFANFHYNGKELYIALDEDTLYDFLFNMLPVFEKYINVYLTSDIRSLIMDQSPSPETNVQLESSSRLLDIGFSIAGIDDDEVTEVLNAVMEKKRYYRLQNGAFLSLENEAFTSMKDMFDELDLAPEDVQDARVQMPVYRGTQVDDLIDMPKHYDEAFKALLNELRSPEDQEYPLPEGLQAELRNYQLTGYQWFKSLSHYHLGGILADDMGLGKTVQCIAYILSEPSDRPHLVVVPSSVVFNWKREFEKFAPSLHVSILTGSPGERQDLIQSEEHADVWITSYATLRQDIGLYREKTFETLILDEAQYIKNYATKTSKAIRQLRAGKRFALSGTPIENSIDELWAIFQVVLPGLMPNQSKFKQLSHDKIISMTRPFIMRRVKEDVLTELPEKIETVHVSELTKEQKELYIGYWRELQKEAAQSMQESGFQQNRMKILAGLTRLRQICCHPSLFVENYYGGSGKLNQLMDTVNQSVANGKRLLIFSQFTSMHEIIIEELKKEGIDYFYLHGQTGTEERVEMSERFNNGEKSVFLVSLKAGGTGLNLTGADTVILYDLWWNPAVEDQATGRAHRFGQKNVVQVIRLLTEGTIEEKIYELQQKKRELIDQVIQPGEAMLTSLSEEDVRELLNI